MDGEERPDLLRLAADGELTPPLCPVCGEDAGVTEPLSLLLYRPRKHPEILFGSTCAQDEPRREEQVAVSRAVLNREQDQGSGEAAIQVPYGLLTVMAARDVDADADALDADSFSAPSVELQRYRQWLAGYAFERFKRASWPAVVSLLEASDPAAVRAVIAAHPVLSDRRCEALLAEVAETADQEAVPQMAQVARERRNVLHQVSEVGLDKAFRPVQPSPTADADSTGNEPSSDEQAADQEAPNSAEPADKLSPSVGAALLGIASLPTAPSDPGELRELLQRALTEMTPWEASLMMEYEHGEMLNLRDLMGSHLAVELIDSPRDRNDMLLAQRLLQSLDHLRETAPYAWAKAHHNKAYVAALLAPAGDLAALDAARADFELALTIRTKDAYPDDWAQTTVALANLLCNDYPGHDPAYLDRSVAMLEEALTHPPPALSALSRLSLQVSLASSVLRRGERQGDTAALRKAEDMFTSVITEATHTDADEIQRIAETNSGMALSLLAERTGRPEDWRAAVTRLRAALADNEKSSVRQRLAPAMNLSIALLHVGDVEAAISLMRQTLKRAASAEMWSAWAGTQNNLGNALLARTDGDHDENVDLAIAAYDAARRIWTREKFPIEWALTTVRMASAYEATQDGRTRAGELLREAVGLIPRAERPVEWARVVNHYAEFEPPKEAIAHQKAAAKVLSKTAFPHEWASIQHNLGRRYWNMATDMSVEVEKTKYLTRAARRFRQALAVRPVSEAPLEWAETAMALASVLRELAGQVGTAHSSSGRGPHYRAEAVRMYRKALHVLTSGSPAERIIQTASALGDMLSDDGQWDEAVRALSVASDAADRQYAANLLRQSREATLAKYNWLSAALAYCFIQLNRPAEAVRALERGRARLLGEALARDPDRVAAAKTTHPAQYAAYVEAVHRLDAAEAASVRLLASHPVDPNQDVYLRQAQQAARNELRSARITFQEASARLPALPPPICTPPLGNVTVYLFTSGADSWALLAWPDRFESLQLPGINGAILRQLASGLLRAQAGRRSELRAALNVALGILGPNVVNPVAAALQGGHADSITLVPVGLFGAFPLHAAAVNSEGRCLLDDIAVSYAPSAAVLAEAQRAAQHRTAEGRQPIGLAVIDSTSGLGFVRPEADAMLHWMGGHRVDAAAGHVLDELVDRTVTHVHFACHGQSLVDRPLESYLNLGHGRRLTVLDLLANDRPELLRGAQMVVASACQSAVTDVAQMPDEFIGLGAGFLAAGVPCFLGTLWPTDDVPAALLMSRFYELLVSHRLSVGEALRQAQRWLRDLNGRELHAYLIENPRFATVRPWLATLAKSRPDQRFYADPVSWSPYIVVGDAQLPPPPPNRSIQ